MGTNFLQYKNVAKLLATLNGTNLAAFLLGTLEGAARTSDWQRIEKQSSKTKEKEK